MSQHLVLDVYYDFSLKELRIKFYTAQQAQQYQERNREGRILADNDRSVWIPIPSEMVHIRASTLGFVMCFKSADAASRWCERVVLGALYADSRDRNEAYIVRQWGEEDLNGKLTGKGRGLRLPDRIPERRGPSPGRVAKSEGWGEEEGRRMTARGFGIEPEEGSSVASRAWQR